jgi:hypothetical protein
LQCFAHAHAEIKQYPYDGIPFDEQRSNNPNAMQQSQQPNMLWMFQTCRALLPLVVREQLLAPDSVGTILTIRLIFMCWACTWAIGFTSGTHRISATGKSTVANILDLNLVGSVGGGVVEI